MFRSRPSRKREIYLLSYSHNDIGYTDLQVDVERKQRKNLERAMQLIRQTRDYLPDARYKWNMETIWALENFLKQALLVLASQAAHEVEKMLHLIHIGEAGEHVRVKRTQPDAPFANIGEDFFLLRRSLIAERVKVRSDKCTSEWKSIGTSRSAQLNSR
jgi:hypothetical protein